MPDDEANRPTILSQRSLDFPPLERALLRPNGLLAVGGDLSEARLVHAYQSGIFPWYNEGEPILWWSPDPRCILYPEKLKISRTLRKSLSNHDYRITQDKAFAKVIANCAKARPGQAETWINNDMQAAYQRLHVRGHAHSIEVWEEERLVGGLYGVSVGRIFCGESMFYHERDASKIALAHLCDKLIEWQYHCIDCQVENAHLSSLGAQRMPRKTFIAMLKEYGAKHPKAGAWL